MFSCRGKPWTTRQWKLRKSVHLKMVQIFIVFSLFSIMLAVSGWVNIIGWVLFNFLGLFTVGLCLALLLKTWWSPIDIYIYYYILIYWLISDVFCSLETTQFVPWTPNDKAGTACAKPHPSRILEDPLRCLAVCEMLVSGGSTCVGYVYVVWTEVDVDIQMVLGLEML